MSYKIIFSILLIFAGCLHAFVSRKIQLNLYPWWTNYLTTAFNATIFSLLLRSKIFSIISSSIFYDVFFNISWYVFALFAFNETITLYKSLGIFFVFVALVFMNL